MIKLIASDIDGTLVKDGEHQMNPEFFDVILKLRDKGIQFAAASNVNGGVLKILKLLL